MLINRAGQLAARCYDATEQTEDLIDAAAALCPDLDAGRGEAWERASEAAGRAFGAAETAWRNPGKIGGVPTGFAVLDRMLNGLQPSDLVLVAARPSIGKTAFALNVAWNASKAVPVGFVSAEMSNKALGHRLLSQVSGIDAQTIRRGRLDRDLYIRLQRAHEEIAGRPIYLSERIREPGQIAREARKLKREHDIGLLAVDYLQLLNPPRGRQRDNREQEVSAISKMLKAAAKDLDVPVLALSQLNRQAELRADKRPQLSDLRDSGALEQDADAVILLHRPALYGILEIGGEDVSHLTEAIIAKQRNGPNRNLATTQGRISPVPSSGA